MDTADVFARGWSARRFLEGAAGEAGPGAVLASKCHGKMDDTDPNAWGNSYKHVVEACNACSAASAPDWIDLYQIHRPQPGLPIDETLRALDDLRRAGKIRYAGCSTFSAWQVCEAHYVAKELGAAGFCCEQPPYNLLDRRSSASRVLLPYLRLRGDPVVAIGGRHVERQILDPIPRARGGIRRAIPVDD